MIFHFNHSLRHSTDKIAILQTNSDFFFFLKNDGKIGLGKREERNHPDVRV
jgi:hypothetical protein